VPRGGGILKSDWWQVWPPEGEQFTPDGRPIKALHYPDMDFIVASLDTAMTEKEENDFSALTVWGVHRDRWDMPRVMLMEAWNERLEFHQLVERTIETCRKRKIDRLLIEAKNNGFSVAQEIRRLTTGQGWGVHLEPVKGDKVARAHSCVAVFAAGQVWAPERRWAQRVIDQCASFPKGQHDDLVDSVTQAIKHLRNSGILLNSGEKQEELRHRLAPAASKRREPVYDV
jgi:predicted phage terminase large subunit-like protein